MYIQVAWTRTIDRISVSLGHGNRISQPPGLQVCSEGGDQWLWLGWWEYVWILLLQVCVVASPHL